MGTTAHGLWYPEDYNAASDVPLNVKDNTESIEAALVAQDAKVDAASANLTYASPIGTVVGYGGATAPTGWLLCDGAAIPAGNAALIALVGANTPDLRGRFLVGAGAGAGLTAYAPNATGGAEAVTLTGAQSGVAAHAHTATAAASTTAHTHTVDPPATTSGTESADHTHAANPGSVTTSSNSHNHTLSVREGSGEGDGYYLDTNPSDSGVQKTLAGTVTSTYAHTHTVDLPSFNTGGRSAAHTHTVQIAPFASGSTNDGHTHVLAVAAAAAAPAASSHENRPPYYALTYIIRAA